MRFLGLGHIALLCNNFHETYDFYTRIVGLRDMFQIDIPGDDKPVRVHYLKIAQDQHVELFDMPYNSDNAWERRPFHHFCIKVDDLYERADRLIREGYCVRHAPADGFVRFQSADELLPNQFAIPYCLYVKDPEGNDLELQAAGKMDPEPDMPPMTAPYLSHIGMRIQNFEKTVAFYSDLLGMEKVMEFPYSERLLEMYPIPGYTTQTPRGAFLKVAPGQYLELFNEPLSDRLQIPDYSYSHLVFLVDDIEATARELEAKGITLYMGQQYRNHPYTVPYKTDRPGPAHSYVFFIQDPEGNDIEIMMCTKQSLQHL